MKKVVEGTQKVTKAGINKVVMDESISKSGKMKLLFDMGMEVKEIATVMGVRYNFVYNVVSNYCNMNGIAVETQKKESKKDQIIELYLSGKTNKEISIELKSNYNYVFNTIKSYKAAQPTVEAAE
jgi:transposase-like protein